MLETPGTIDHYVGMGVRISRELLDDILQDAANAAPAECCGLLLGESGTNIVQAIMPARNVAPDPVRHFEIDPSRLFAAHKQARAGGLAIIGHYHSHPSGHATPSPTDRAMAAGQGEYWLIVGSAGEAGLWQALRDMHGEVRFDAVELTIAVESCLASGSASGQ